jgi:hypothetical protein
MATGLPQTDSNKPRLHFDIYAILEGSQELYLGHEVQVNVNLVEIVKLTTKDGQSLEKCYISPTKRRGVERRCLIWAPVKSGVLLGDKQKCGIPDTCAKPDCPICSTYGGLVTKDKGDRKRSTLIGRVTHAGGVAVQDIYPVEKQRAMHPSMLNRNEQTTTHLKKEEKEPTPFKRQYNQPGIIYPVYNHVLSVTDQEFASVAYAFLDALPRIGSGNPKGIAIVEAPETNMPLLVLDRYLVPRGKRPIVSPSVTKPEIAIQDFIRLARSPEGTGNHIQLTHFERWIGDEALKKLQDYSSQFVDNVLQSE